MLLHWPMLYHTLQFPDKQKKLQNRQMTNMYVRGALGYTLWWIRKGKSRKHLSEDLRNWAPWSNLMLHKSVFSCWQWLHGMQQGPLVMMTLYYLTLHFLSAPFFSFFQLIALLLQPTFHCYGSGSLLLLPLFLAPGDCCFQQKKSKITWRQPVQHQNRVERC